ncbi:2-C-methyl-D-erythritol 4-phosphate cytidylyltransferase [Amphibiibacter pelophylacis]|uniref:2-C-methyl-D-erythritol 4-phosphate cytidylyltransferase n=1 Tax=Amphibiibacter pelophylacis TaxID=1799477 RepID=A0ACC6P3X9_9BURK
MTAPTIPPASERFWALVPCAGVGVRAGQGGPKQYADLAGRTVVEHTLRALAAVPELHATLLVLAPGDAVFAPQIAPRLADLARPLHLACVGGAERADTVAAGLTALQSVGARADDWVLVHDAARCLVPPQAVSRLIAQCRHDPVGGLLALPVADTLKRAAPASSSSGENAAARSETTVDRRGLWAAQTPQMFRLELLARALQQRHSGTTDEASAIEALGLKPRLVEGDARNFKLTWPADFEMAGRLVG